MAIHETDSGENRWERESWRTFELWEKLEVREKRRRKIWIAITALVFLGLSSIPVISDQGPRWQAKRASRKTAELIVEMTTVSARERKARRLRFVSGGEPLSYVVESPTQPEKGCGADQFVTVESGTVLSPLEAAGLRIIDPTLATRFSIPNMVDQFCYDPIEGNTHPILGIGIVPVKDLSPVVEESRLDRMVILLIKGREAALAFN